MLEKIKTIFFDSDDTIVDHKACEKQALLHLFEGIGTKYKQEYQEIFRPLDRKLWDDVALYTSEIPKEEIAEYRFKILFDKIHLDYKDYKNANKLFQEGLEHSVALMEKADEVIKDLYNKNYKLYVVTNGLIRLQKPRIINSKIGSYFTDIIVSEEVGERKPNPKIFNTLLKRYNLKSTEVVMIGNSILKDIQGAQNANIKTIWYNPKQKNNNTEIIPDYEIKSLLELKNIFLGEQYGNSRTDK